MSRTQRVDPRDTGKFTRPQIKKVGLSGIRYFEKGVDPNILTVREGRCVEGSLRTPLSQIPGAKQTIAKALYLTALELAQSTKEFSSKAHANALDVVRPWKSGKFIGIRRLKALEGGNVTPTLRELTAVYYAAGENKDNATLLAYMLRILSHATKAENKEVAQAAKDCIESLSQQPLCMA